MLPRSGLPCFDYVRAGTPGEVVRLRQQAGDELRLLMGGTDLLVRMRDGLLSPRLVVDVKHLPGMQTINLDGELTVGAAVPLNCVACHPAVLAHYRLLAESAASVASYQLRNRATLGGNLCNASPAADTAPAVLLLDASLSLVGAAGERRVPASEFFVGPGRTAIQPDEFLAAVSLPLPPAGSAGRYLKLGRNRVGDLAIAGVAVLGWPDPAAAHGYRFRVGLASVAPVPLRALPAEEVLAGRAPGEAAFAAAADAAAATASPIDDVRASAAYRRAMVRILTLRGLCEVWAELSRIKGLQGV
jgi:carbon-monoxide dehydrogenase medium subunit